jgi:hypothetical protein
VSCDEGQFATSLGQANEAKLLKEGAAAFFMKLDK